MTSDSDDDSPVVGDLLILRFDPATLAIVTGITVHRVGITVHRVRRTRQRGWKLEHWVTASLVGGNRQVDFVWEHSAWRALNG